MSASTNFKNVQWGWRIQCCHPDCDHEYTHYDPTEKRGGRVYIRTGPPPIVSVSEMKQQDWYCKWERWGTPRYVAYCPEHAADAIAWSKAMDVWDEARHKVGKDTYISLTTRIKDWFDQKVLGRKVASVVELWMVDNPRPTPPWVSPTLLKCSGG